MRNLARLITFLFLVISQSGAAQAQVSASIMSPGNQSTFTKTPANMSKLVVTANVVGDFGVSPDMMVVRLHDASGVAKAWGSGPIDYPSILAYHGTASVDVWVPSLAGDYTVIIDLYRGGVLQLSTADLIWITIE